jgi:hypothetical protein
MKRQRLLWIAVVLSAGVLAMAMLSILWPIEPITRDVYKRIKQGMSEEEVVAILVLPAAREATYDYILRDKRLRCFGDQVWFEVEFDNHGKVSWKEFYEKGPSLLQRLKSLWWTVRGMF